jgi:pimeloyl-ACP methyl ester carboxylesterase
MRTDMRRFTAVGVVLAVLGTASPALAHNGRDEHSRRKPPAIVYEVDESSLPFEAVPGFEDSDRSWGVLRGAGYRIEVPAEWNGDLVMWAHGFRGTDTRLFFNLEEVPFREWLLENGYAWAASTYSKNDYNVGTAVEDTHRLAKFFKHEHDKPDRTYIAGASMGGHITAASIEQHRSFYDGAMPVCGVLGDYELFDFFLDFNVTAQQLALGSSQFPVAEDYAVSTAPTIKAALELAPGTWPVALNATGAAFKQLVENRSGGDRPNFDEAWFFWNSFPEFGSGIPGNFLFDLGTGDGTIADRPGVVVENSDVFYDTDLVVGPSNDLEIALNEGVARVTADKGARRSGDVPSPELEGKIKVPVVTMHNLGDLFVPFHMETEYAATVAARGNSDLVVQRAIRGVGHCDFSTTEYETAFADLVNWVENGVRPAGDDVGDPAAVADASFGCQFTDQTAGAHLLPAPCP